MSGSVMDGWEDVEAVFDRPETPSPAAAADRAIKMSSIGLFERALPDFIYKDLGLREVEILQLKQWLQNNAGENLVAKLLESNISQTPQPVPAPVAVEAADESAL